MPTSQDSHRYQATGTPALSAKRATRVVLPEPAGPMTRPSRRPHSLAICASRRTIPCELDCGIRTRAATTAAPVAERGSTATLPVRCLLDMPIRLSDVDHRGLIRQLDSYDEVL